MNSPFYGLARQQFQAPVPLIGARVMKNTNQSITVAAGNTQVNWTVLDWGTDNMWLPGQPTKLWAPYDGYYYMSFSCSLDTGTHGNRFSLSMRKNVAGTILISARTVVHAVTGGFECVPVATIAPLLAGDYVECFVVSPDATQIVQGTQSETHAELVWIGT